MMRVVAFRLVLCCLIGIGFVTILALLSRRSRIEGSFLRLFRAHALQEVKAIDFGANSFYIAGGTPSTVYLSSYKSPLDLISLNVATGDTLHHIIRADSVFDEKYWSLRVRVDSPSFILFDGSIPRLYRGHVKTWHAQRLAAKAFFMDIESIGERRFVVKSLIGDDNHSELGIMDQCSDNVRFNEDILTKQVDGYFCAEGYLVFNKELSTLVYMYRYRNEFLTLDTLLNLRARYTTIDSNSVAKISVETIHSTNSRVFASQPLVVNEGIAVSGNYLFVNAPLVALNEPREARVDESAIDVYSVEEGNYIFSFYLFNYDKREKLKEFCVFGRYLVALFEKHLQVFVLSQSDFGEPLE